MFHITKEKNLPYIFFEGLIPGKRRGITTSLRDKQTKVFLTNDIDRIVETQAGKAWIRKHRAVALKIDITELEVTPVEYDNGTTYTISDFEFETDRIPVKYIKYSHKLYK